MSDLLAKLHTPHDRAILVAAAIVFVGLAAVAVAILRHEQAGLQDISGPLIAAGVFVFLGLAYLGTTRLAELHEHADTKLDDAIARAEEAARWARKTAELRGKVSGHERSPGMS
jgi:hypothetical protein